MNSSAADAPSDAVAAASEFARDRRIHLVVAWHVLALALALVVELA
ncbi:hypothetical protein [Halorubellus sp. PRR65]|nr:hypothetical protein [Halorubellus sp. PRR65]